MPIEISIKVPEPLAERLGASWEDLPRHTLEALVADTSPNCYLMH